MRAGIALGSNLGDRLANLRDAWQRVRGLPGASAPFLSSAVYETEPIDSAPDAPAFYNAVVEIGYSGHPAQLLEALLSIEATMGRPSKRPRNAPRPIDLDLLYAGNQVLATSDIVVPHPRLHLRRFVLQPLHDLQPHLRLPGREATVSEMLVALPPEAGQVKRLADPLEL